ncbi:hypothetical protein BKE30_15445 [Alkanindiges hydrocarboniclasticus]|uniref:Uncharacterized protein n=1 Tax=Alkanindiges hydrocarboniclasticus TaxID=1907941 RepID=A0A1S8CSC2_9GAMM|nr:hypothetical protein [Alkanindiges hydrocarboniclasticus]ONG37035.1 hypothetical protein BKE30_15445 [Alkanindiges hydrocarboniclasticus]
MRNLIIAELQSIDVQFSSFSPNDIANGKISFWWRGSGRPMLYGYSKFSPVNAIRILEDWDITGLAHSSYEPAHTLNFSIITDYSKNTHRLTCGKAFWEFPTNGEIVRFINSAATNELLIRFIKSMPATNDGRFQMSEGSYIYIKDIPI